MPRSINSSEVKQEHLRQLGPILGTHYNALYNEVAWLHVRWKQFKDLFGTSPSRIAILNQALAIFSICSGWTMGRYIASSHPPDGSSQIDGEGGSDPSGTASANKRY